MLGRMAAASEAIDVATHLSIVAPSRSEEAGFASWFWQSRSTTEASMS